MKQNTMKAIKIWAGGALLLAIFNPLIAAALIVAALAYMGAERL